MGRGLASSLTGPADPPLQIFRYAEPGSINSVDHWHESGVSFPELGRIRGFWARTRFS